MSFDSQRRCAVLLAAGDGKRMKSKQPKVLCEVLMKPMITWVEQACRKAGIEEVYVVAGAGAEQVKQAVSPECNIVIQSQRRGTGHAVMMAAQALEGGGDVAVLNGDAPFISAEVLAAAYAQHIRQHNAVTLVTARLQEPFGYGRIVRTESGEVSAIVEESDATQQEKLIDEINSGTYWFKASFLQKALSHFTADNAQGEYYLTDVVKIARKLQERVDGYACHSTDVVLGANDRKALKMLNDIARNREIERHLSNGVDIPFDDGVIIGTDVHIAPGTKIMPGTILAGNTTIGENCVIGPNSYLMDSQVGDGSSIIASYMTSSTVGCAATIGPFSQLRPGSHIMDGVKIGDFVEVKNSTIGEKTSIAHLTYIGDSDVGAGVNFGCGVVTVNYDGQNKFRTTIGDHAFIGCNTNLIAPVKVGDGAYTAAGTTVDEDIPDDALAIGRVRQEIKKHWAKGKIKKKI